MSRLTELLQQQEALQIQIAQARKEEQADAIAQVRALVEKFGLTEKDVFSSARRSAGTRAGGKVEPKYRDPATGNTWSGRGKPPKWIEGKDRSQFLIG